VSPKQSSLKISQNGPSTIKCIEITRASKQASITPRVTVMQMWSKMRNKALCSRCGNKFGIGDLIREIYRHIATTKIYFLSLQYIHMGNLILSRQN
jgi:hypothetical protein